MKKISLFIISFLCCLSAQGQTSLNLDETAGLRQNMTQASKTDSKPLFNWGLLWSGSLNESASTPMSYTLNNRGEIRLHFFPFNKNADGFLKETLAAGFMLRGQILDRHALALELNPFQITSNPEKAITHFTGGLYHKQTGSRLLFGVLDEWGLSARVRNPWIRSPPFPGNHKPLMADLKTAVSGTKEDEVYLYLSSPFFNLDQKLKLRGFISMQTLVNELTPSVSGGVDFSFSKNTNLLLETFYTGKTLLPLNAASWFSNPPALPEREFHLTAAAFVFSNPFVSVSSDFALSDTFAWGKDIYVNLGVTLTPSLPFGNRTRPLALSLAVDGSGERFVNRDGSILNEGFRTAAKIEWKGRSSSLLRFSSVLRGKGFGENFNRSAIDFYYRFPAQTKQNKGVNGVSAFPIKLTRVSLSADRNAENPLKINDSFSGTVGMSIGFPQIKPLSFTLSGSVKGKAASRLQEAFLFPFPMNSTDETWNWDNTTVNCEIYWPPSVFQFRAKCGVTFLAEKEEKWDLSLAASIRLKNGRFSFKAASADFPYKWNFNISWRAEMKEIK